MSMCFIAALDGGERCDRRQLLLLQDAYIFLEKMSINCAWSESFSDVHCISLLMSALPPTHECVIPFYFSFPSSRLSQNSSRPQRARAPLTVFIENDFLLTGWGRWYLAFFLFKFRHLLFVQSDIQLFIHTFIHWWWWLPCKVPASTSGAVWGSVSCPRIPRHAGE